MSQHPEITDISSPSRPRFQRSIVRYGVGALVLVAIVAGLGIWWFFKDDAPPQAALETAVASIDTDADSGAPPEPATEESAAAPAAPAPETTSDDPTGDLTGTWTVDTSVGEFSYEDSTGTFVGFRVDEELRGIGSTTAVGRTPAVAGTIVIEGTSVTVVDIEADMTAITTNDGRRDDEVHGALETSAFPTATFVLTSPIEIGDAATTGEAVSTAAAGDLTIHGVTQPVEVAIDAQVVNDTIVIVGSVEIAFADYGVEAPTNQFVLSVDDHGVVELQLFLAR